MTKLLDQALEVVRTLPPHAQDDIARVVLRLAARDDEASPVPLSSDERAAIATSWAAARRGEFATFNKCARCGANTDCESSLHSIPAVADLDAILDHIAAHSPRGARRVQGRIQAIIDLLLLHPNIDTRTDDPVIRRMTPPRYPSLVFYEATDTEIIMLSHLWNSKDLSALESLR